MLRLPVLQYLSHAARQLLSPFRSELQKTMRLGTPTSPPLPDGVELVKLLHYSMQGIAGTINIL